MKITKEYLRDLIKEELEKVEEGLPPPGFADKGDIKVEPGYHEGRDKYLEEKDMQMLRDILQKGSITPEQKRLIDANGLYFSGLLLKLKGESR